MFKKLSKRLSKKSKKIKKNHINEIDGFDGNMIKTKNDIYISISYNLKGDLLKSSRWYKLSDKEKQVFEESSPVTIFNYMNILKNWKDNSHDKFNHNDLLSEDAKYYYNFEWHKNPKKTI
jgi:hypothetical protein